MIFKEEEYINFLKEEKVKDITVRTYISDVKFFFLWLDREYPELEYYQISKNVLEEYLDQESLNKRLNTVDKKLTIIRSYFDFLWRNNHLANFDPAVKIKRRGMNEERKDEYWLDIEEIERAIQAAGEIYRSSDKDLSLRLKSMIEIFFYGGLKLQEAVNLRRSSVIFHHDKNLISLCIEGESHRIIELELKKVKHLDAYLLSLNNIDSIHFFSNPSGKSLSARTIQDNFRKLSDHIGIRIYPRKLRNSYIVARYLNGDSREDIAQSLGIDQIVFPDSVIEFSKASKDI